MHSKPVDLSFYEKCQEPPRKVRGVMGDLQFKPRSDIMTPQEARTAWLEREVESLKELLDRQSRFPAGYWSQPFVSETARDRDIKESVASMKRNAGLNGSDGSGFQHDHGDVSHQDRVSSTVHGVHPHQVRASHIEHDLHPHQVRASHIEHDLHSHQDRACSIEHGLHSHQGRACSTERGPLSHQGRACGIELGPLSHQGRACSTALGDLCPQARASVVDDALRGRGMTFGGSGDVCLQDRLAWNLVERASEADLWVVSLVVRLDVSEKLSKMVI